jgi:hypothetical protein
MPRYDKERFEYFENMLNKGFHELFVIILLGIFDAKLQQNKRKVSNSLSKQIQSFVLKETTWNTVVSRLISSKNIEEDKEKSFSEKSKKSSQGGQKSLLVIIPTEDFTEALNEVSFCCFQNEIFRCLFQLFRQRDISLCFFNYFINEMFCCVFTFISLTKHLTNLQLFYNIYPDTYTFFLQQNRMEVCWPF